MRVIEYHHVPRKVPTRRPNRSVRMVCGFMLVIIIASLSLATWRYLRPLPEFEVNLHDFNYTAQRPKLPWPKTGESAVGAVGYGVLAQQGLTQPKPIASITKIVTALTILQKKPLHGDETGPKITITKADQALYDAYVAIDGSVVPVRVGEQLTELQMLQAMLLPSANNLADTLAIWAFGSLDSHIRAANAYVTSLGMSHTKITDASGISATTVSTASDLIKLGEAAMRQPIIARIVSQTEVAFPVVQKIYNVNGMLGRDGIIGIKPGNTDEAGGCFLGAAAVTLPGGKHLTVLTAVLGAPNLVQALVDSRHLLASIPSGFGKIEVLPSQASVGYLNIPWGQPVSIKSQQPLVINDWLGRSYEPVIKMKSLRGSQTAGSIAGTAEILTPDGVKRTNLVLESAVMEPPSGWRRANIF